MASASPQPSPPAPSPTGPSPAPPPYPTLVRLPDRLEGRRVVIRPLEVADAPAVFEAIEESRPRLVDWVPWAKTRHKTLAETVDYCARMKAQWILREALYPGIFRRSDGRYLGGVGFHPVGHLKKIDWTFPALEIGYWIRSTAEGKGYVGEATDLMLGLAFDAIGAPRVEARCDPTNARSLRVIERAGFVREGVLRNENRWWDGGLGDTVVHSMIPEEWKARAGRTKRAEAHPPAAPAPQGKRVTVPERTAPTTTIAVPDRIEGPRVLLRPFAAGDAPALFEAIHESLGRLYPWMPWTQDHQRVEDTLDFILRSEARWILRTNLLTGVFDRATGRVLGGTGLHPAGREEIDWSIPKLEIGYWIRTGEEGKGYVVEAVRLLTRVAFETLGANRVQIQCDTRNVRSVRVMEAAGYAREAVFRRDERMPDGHVRDTAMYAMTPEDWRRQARTRTPQKGDQPVAPTAPPTTPTGRGSAAAERPKAG